MDGKKFDSSRDRCVRWISFESRATLINAMHRGEPFETEIGVGKVIKGWDVGVPQLSLRQRAVLTASPDFVSCQSLHYIET